MNLITRKQQPKFARKPYTILNAVQQVAASNSQEQAPSVSSGKKLKISNNVLNLIVMAPQQNKQIQLSRLLFTNQKSVACSSAQKRADLYQNSTLSKRMFLEYSPDSIMESPAAKGNMDDSEILIEGYSQKSQKAMISTNSATNFTFQKSEKQGLFYQKNANITPFALADTQTSNTPESSITLSFITSNKFIFMLNYTYKTQARNTLAQNPILFKGDSQKLMNRMRKFFKKFPLSMFVFYIEVLKQYENIQLREFLMKNSIRYTTKQILSLEQHINIGLDMCKGEELLEYMFMTEEEDDMIVVNFCNSNFQKQIEPFQNNFWKALGPVFRHKLHETQQISFQIQKIEEFLLKLI